MKKIVASILCACMISTLLVGCGGDGKSAAPGEAASDGAAADNTGAAADNTTGAATDSTADNAGSGSKGGANTINVWAFTDEVPGMIEKYIEAHPDFGYEINTTIIATTDGAYQPALDQALASGGADAPDIYCAEAAFILKYTQGGGSQ